MNTLVLISIFYLFGIFIAFSIGAIIDIYDYDTKYGEIKYIFLFFIVPFLLLKDFIIFSNKYLTQNNLKQMNFKVLGKAMGFMFLPTLGVLLMLLVGFFDPVTLWNWIKSDSGGAIFTRIIIFILEVGLVVLLYFNYLKEEVKKELISNPDKPKGSGEFVNSSTEIRSLLEGNYSDYYKIYDTQSENIKIIEKIKK